ncbi:ElaB/YqjD/DUF883 family membrane-anchored ribosome-binding protein [Paucimonas lemoignei]|uniref:ElaB/YqjD/DUF883 family membrane-anchored ribosome-binding protein n=1 Tax=Paucimonas lemoignei TaxID=29443 RepID=A0A4R3HUC6_PAULE|nr:DUF883 family protein [Paucimonas lemoignei]TCS35605.1 ElaB/YqjD/DUF883 family membrane-anchored ribosome-binding protein [Paucimonas lemoignei]
MTASSYKTVRNDMKSLVRDAQQLFREASVATGERADELRAKGQELLDSAAQRAQELQTAAMETGKEFASHTDSYVKDNPWKAVAISAGVGLVVGMLIGRK